MNNQNNYTEESRGVAMNIFAVLGFIAILLAGLWATVQLVKQISRFSFDFAKPSMSTALFGEDEKLAVVKNTDVLRSGASTQIVWNLSKKDQEAEGSALSFSYACKAGTYVKVAEGGTGAYRAIPCNAPYGLNTKESKLTIIPVLTDTNVKTAEIAYALTYTPKEGDTQSTSGILTVTNNAALATKAPRQVAVATPTVPAVATTPTRTNVMKTEGKAGTVSTRTVVQAPVTQAKARTRNITKQVPAPKTYTRTVTKLVPVRNSNPNGLPDLTVKVLEVRTLNAQGATLVRFEVANIGTKLAKDWTFTATLPTEPTYTYVSQAQGTLYAGERAEMQMTFDKLKTGNNNILISVDAANAIQESVESNNAIVHPIVGK